jgi:hypothetical protein
MPAEPAAGEIMPVLSLSQHAERLRRLSWRDMFKVAWLTLLGSVALKLIVPAAFKDSVRPLIVVAPLLPFVAKDLAHWPDALARLRAAAAVNAWPRMLTACLPPELLGLLRLDGAMRRGFLNWLRRRPQPALPAGETFGYLERGSYRTAIAIALMATLFELPLDAALMPLFVTDTDTLRLLHLLMAVGSLSTLVWVLGDRWLVGRGCHVLGAEGLALQVGARTAGTIPLHAIADCGRIDTSPADWCRRHGIAPRDTLLASPLDKPNAVLILKPDSPVRLSHMGVERTGLACVFLYVDHPHRLCHALRIEGQE